MSESKYTLDEVYRRIENYKNSVYGAGNNIALHFLEKGGGYIEVYSNLGSKGRAISFANWQTLELFLDKFERTHKE